MQDVAGAVYRQNLWKDFFGIYSKVCACCDEKDTRFLTVDHKHGDGAVLRKKGGEPQHTLRIAIEEYRPDLFQTLCMNCNAGKSRNKGVCPHKQSKVTFTDINKKVKDTELPISAVDRGFLTCESCKLEKLLTDFYRSTTTKTGYTRKCRMCYTNGSRRYRHSDKSWKKERLCVQCNAVFMPCNPAQVVCSKKCRQKVSAITSSWRSSEKVRKSNRNYKEKLRKQFLDMYGYICACCKEDNIIFLTLDHVQNDGNIDRQRLGGKEPYRVLREAIKQYDPTKYQVLCFNCNHGKRMNNGVCPHSKELSRKISLIV
jgi:hypothetical protein